MKIYIVHFVTQHGTTIIEKAFKNLDKAVNYCHSQQQEYNEQQEYRDYFFKTLELED